VIPPSDVGSLRATARRLLLWIKSIPLRLRPVEARFAGIYRSNAWRGGESASGPGSSLAATAGLRAELPALLARLSCRSLLDAPCGDVHWLRSVELPAITYTGVDVVPEVITRNRAELTLAGRTFVCLNLCDGDLPRADLILCRDGLVHLSNRDVQRALANFRRSGATYLLTTHFPHELGNPPIATGAWRPLNLEQPPFSLPPPLLVLADGTGIAGNPLVKTLALWRLADLGPRAAGAP
jgi:hypothetical protein